MDHTEYQDVLRKVLDGATEASSTRLATIHRAATDAAADILIEVFVDEDAEGPFSIGRGSKVTMPLRSTASSATSESSSA